MVLLKALYPYFLAGSNMILGWVVFQSLESFLGLLLLVTGMLIVLTMLYSVLDGAGGHIALRT